jgi:glycine reductase complex component B subunit alpha and beta
MKLSMATFPVKTVEFSSQTAWKNGTLLIDPKAVRELILKDAVFTDVSVEVVYPRERTRIIHVLDAVEPRVKVEGGSGCFPGLLGPARSVGSGTTHRLSGVAVLGIGLGIEVPSEGETGVLTFNEGMIDMSGPAQPYCACSDTINICLCFKVREACSYVEFDASTRLATLKVADYLARSTFGLEPPEKSTYELAPVNPDLPRIAYINQIQSQGFLCRTFLYGAPMEAGFTPTLLHPNELLDGAVVSGNYRNFFKACTYLQQNNHVVRELYRRHGEDLNFVGQIIGRGHFEDIATKERQGQYAAKMASLVKAQGAVLTIEGSGNAFIDFMLTVRALEEMGIAAVPLVHEFGGIQGDDQPLVFVVPEAVSIVTGGGVDRLLEIPAMERVVGGEVVRFAEGPCAFKPMEARSSFVAGPTYLYCAYWQMQIGGLTALDY